MKVGMVGAGNVGAACLLALAMRDVACDVVVIDRNRERAKGVVADLQYGAELASRVDLRTGAYADLAGAALVMITAGQNEKAGGATDRADASGRLRLLDANVAVYRDIVPKVVAAAPDAVILVITDPPDPLADLARRLADHERVLSSGTFLDSLRFRFHLGRRLAVHPMSVAAQVVGEHGTSEVFLWSSARVSGVPVAAAGAQAGQSPEALKRSVEDDVRFANITIIEGTGASQYGIGMASARIAQAILRNERVVMPVGSFNAEYGVTLSLPSVVGREGVARVLEPALSELERAGLERSAAALREAAKRT
ncbi:MAG: lactate/malate family dehydrogenase [Rhodanobacteraceae bacterium]